jgi:hypothetical protein
LGAQPQSPAPKPSSKAKPRKKWLQRRPQKRPPKWTRGFFGKPVGLFARLLLRLFRTVNGGDLMYLNIKSDGSVTLEETDDFDRFEIRSAIDLASGDISDEFSRLSEPTDDDRYWIDADAIVTLSSRADDLKWCSTFWAMLETAEPYGFADVARKRIKSHVAK